ncbi:ATP-binding protein [Acrocarpospora sp. B8E8]|uniref:ATP-binding protein n=1 Tax=Acrocarpospora sp. B8E8 TaxID=3153572 RepID=UPI00325E8CD7
MMDRDLAETLRRQADFRDDLARTPMVEYLALLGTFKAADVSADVLRLLCERLPRDEAMLSEGPRIDALAAMLRRGGAGEPARVRALLGDPPATPLQRMLDSFVLDLRIPVAERDEDELVASISVWRWFTDALALAGLSGQVPVLPDLDMIERRLSLLDLTRAVRTLVNDGCFGRERELAALHRHANAPGSRFATIVYGVGGVGKSTLIARFVMDLADRGRPWAYLDFDRPTLSSYDPVVVLNDIIRQVSVQFPDDKRVLRRWQDLDRSAKAGGGLETYGRGLSYEVLASSFAKSARERGLGGLVVVLDTFEEVGRADRFTRDKLRELFTLLAHELPDFRLVISGRAPAETFGPVTTVRRLHLRLLPGPEAVTLLAMLTGREAERAQLPDPFDQALGAEIVRLVGGLPLTLRLAARVLAREGAAAVTDAADRARVLDRVRTDFVRGFLYQRILAHLRAGSPEDGEALRQVARAAIVLTKVTPELIERVLVPALDPPPATPAEVLYRDLAAEMAFIEGQEGVLRLREELRGPALAALKYDDPQLVARIHERSVAFYQAEGGAAVEIAYHRLARGEPAAVVAAEAGEDALRPLEPSLDDFPEASARLIQQALAGTPVLTAEVETIRWERRTLAAVEVALRAGELGRARTLLGERDDRTESSPLYRLECRLYEAEGDLVQAVDFARRDLAAATAAGDAVRFAAAAVRVAELEERRGRPDQAVRGLRDAMAADLLGGHPGLRLELLLNVMTIEERAGLGDGDSRWTRELDARALLQRAGPRAAEENTGLVRLLAAALGEEEPRWVEAAARRIGLGLVEDRALVAELVAAIAAWDSAQDVPGTLLARATGTTSTADALPSAWNTALSGLGVYAGPLLMILWSLGPPPEPVRTALRRIYLWWRTPRDRPEAVTGEVHFLAETPLDWSRAEVQGLERILFAAYPTSTHLMSIAARAGLDVSAITWGRLGRPARDLLSHADAAGMLGPLVAAVLADRSVAAFHSELAQLVGERWLADHMISPQTGRDSG